MSDQDNAVVYARDELKRQAELQLNANNISEAKECINKLIALEIKDNDTILMIAMLLFRVKEYMAAIHQFELFIRENPHNLDVLYLTAKAYSNLNKVDESNHYLERIIAQDKTYANAYFLQGLNIAQNNCYDSQAVFCYLKALEYAPENDEIHAAAGQCYYHNGDYKKAQKHFEKAYHLAPKVMSYQQRVILMQAYLFYFRMFNQNKRIFLEHMKADIDESADIKLTTLDLMYFTEDNVLLQNVAVNYAKRFMKNIVPYKHSVQAKTHLKIGYLCGDFSNHAVGFLLQDIFKFHDSSSFTIHAYSLSTADDEITQMIKSSVDSYQLLTHLTDEKAAALINHDEIDILVDLSGNTGNARSGILARQPAPIQCHFLGNIGTQGAPYLQYYLSHKAEIPDNHGELFHEKIVFLPDTVLAINPDSIANTNVTKQQYDLPEDKFVFASFATSNRISSKIFKDWMKILKHCPESVLWLPCSQQQQVINLREHMAHFGIDAGRLYTSACGKLSETQSYLACDMVLDVDVINCFTSSLLALREGVPVITVKGKACHTKKGAILAHALLLPELALESHREYVAKAIALYNNPAHLNEIRKKLSTDKHKLPLYNRELYIRNLERAFMSMQHQLENNLHQDIVLE